MRKYFVYLLAHRDGHYLTGITDNLEQKLANYQPDQSKERGPTIPSVELVYFEEFTSLYTAIARERRLKRAIDARRGALLAGDISELITHV